jgi:glutathione S-transferase
LARAHQDIAIQACLDEIEGPLWTWSKHKFVLPEDKRVPAVQPVCEAEFHRGQKNLERRLGGGPFATGETFTIADILLGHCASWAQNGPKWTWREGPVAAYFERIRARPALANAMEKGAAAIA